MPPFALLPLTALTLLLTAGCFTDLCEFPPPASGDEDHNAPLPDEAAGGEHPDEDQWDAPRPAPSTQAPLPEAVLEEAARCARARAADAPAVQLLAAYDFRPGGAEEHLIPDLSGHGFDLAGTLPLGQGPDGRPSARFEGRSISARGNPLAGRTCFTVSIWVKLPQPEANIKLLAAAWWNGGLNASGFNIGTHYPEAWTDNLGDYWGPGSSRGFQINPKGIPADTWSWLVIRADGERFQEWVDGRLVNDWEMAGLPIGQGDDLTVGGWMGGFGFHGELADLRMYDQGLLPDEIATP